MSRTTGPSDNSGTGGAEESPIAAARECVRNEQEAVETILAVLESFEELITDIRTHMAQGVGETHPRVLSDNSPKSGAEAVLDAFRETFGEEREREFDDDSTCLHGFAQEFSQELAEHLRHACEQGAFPPALKRRLLAEIRESQRRHRSALDSLEAELNSLKTLDHELAQIYSRLEELEPRVGDEIAFSALIDRYHEVDEHLERLDDLARTRQALINSETGEHGYTIDQRRFTLVIYDDLDSQHPGLTEIANCAGACRETRRNLLLDLGLAD